MKDKITFQELINRDQPVLIDFYADWCGPCIAMGPILKEVAKQVGESASIIKIDVDQNPEIANHLKIKGIPTFILYKKGQIKWRQSGMQSAKALTDILHEVIDQEL